MYYQYIAYTTDKKIAKGTQPAASADIATKILASRGYKVLSLKPAPSFLPTWERILPAFGRVPMETLITFSRQFALLHESGMDIVTSLELLKLQTVNKRLKTVLGDIVTDLRRGDKLSEAMGKHPNIFSNIYIQSISVGEQTGNIETVLRQMADYLEREDRASKSVKNAMRYPVIVVIVAIAVIAILTVIVLPTFVSLYGSLGTDLPAVTRGFISFIDWFSKNGLYVLGLIVLVGLGLHLWSRTEAGRLVRDKFILKLPLLGRVAHLNEIIRCCRSISILYQAGLPIPEIMVLAVDSSNNLIIKRSLVNVHQAVLKGEGLSRPMARDPKVFPPMMVQMVGVGEATGNLDNTLLAAADSYETEAADRMRYIIGLIQPTVTIILGIVIAIIAISLISAMYSLYGQV